MNFEQVSDDLKFFVRELQSLGMTDDPLYADSLALHVAFLEYEASPRGADSARQKQILLGRFAEILGRISRFGPPTAHRLESIAALQQELSDLSDRLGTEVAATTPK